MDGSVKFRRDNETTKYIKKNKGKKIMESHDRQQLEGTWQIEEKD